MRSRVSSCRTGVIQPAMLFALLIGFLAMHAMSATTAGAGHHGATTLAPPHTHHAAAENPGSVTATSTDGVTSRNTGTPTDHTAEPVAGSDDDVVTTGCVVALAGFLGLLAFLARLRSSRRGHSRRNLAEHLRDGVVKRKTHPPPQPRLHISLCVLRV